MPPLGRRNFYDRRCCDTEKGEGRNLQKGGPWVYDNEIADISPGAETAAWSGSAARTAGRWARLLNRRSKLTVRMLTRDPDAEINEDFFLMRLKTPGSTGKRWWTPAAAAWFSGRRTPAGAGGGQVLRRAGGGIPGSGNRPLKTGDS